MDNREYKPRPKRMKNASYSPTAADGAFSQWCVNSRREVTRSVKAMTNQKIIDIVLDLIRGSFADDFEVDLGMLLLTVDAREHCVPTHTEVNKALRQLKLYEIVRDKRGVRIVRSEMAGAQIVRQSDIVRTLNSSRSTLGSVGFADWAARLRLG